MRPRGCICRRLRDRSPGWRCGWRRSRSAQDIAHGALDRALGHDRPGDRGVDRLAARRRRRRRRAARDHPHRHARAGSTSSMREIVQDILAAPMPVVVYVSPERRPRGLGRRLHHRGRRRRGDGAADQHRLGERDRRTARTSSGTLGARSRTTPPPPCARSPRPTAATATLAERMVTEAANVTAEEALDARPDRRDRRSDQDLLAQLDGFRGPGPEGADARRPRASRSRTTTCRSSTSCSRSWSTRPSPTCCCWSAWSGSRSRSSAPGLIIPGTLGVISFLLGAYGTAQLPVTAVGIALLVIGVGADHRRGPPRHPRDTRRHRGGGAGRVGPAAVQHRLERVRGLGPGGDRGRRPARRRARVRRSARRSQAGRAPPQHRAGGDGRRRSARSATRSTRSARCSSRGRCGAPASPTTSPTTRPTGCSSAALECASSRSRG